MSSRTLYILISTASLLICGIAALVASPSHNHQLPLSSPTSTLSTTTSVSPTLFSSLERLSRLVDITYCVGTTGIAPPFTCISRCSEFPTLQLISTWSTGLISLADSCGYIAVDQSPTHPSIIVAFRGTYSITNTVIDLSTIPQEYVPYPSDPEDPDDGKGKKAPKCENCTVHTGFLTSWQGTREYVLPGLMEAIKEHPTYPVQLLGHSLGGAVAALAALEIKLSHNVTNLTVTTFGEPRIGNHALAGYLDEAFNLTSLDGYDPDLEKRSYRRVTHVGDPVPLLPLGEWGYASHGGEVFIEKRELQPEPADLRLCRGDEDPECIAGGAGNGMGLRPWQAFFAHRDYFWRLGLCVPGGDPWDWGRGSAVFGLLDW
ncbi:hypothetical protein DL546_002702 [Coniochaeta pulveracea]|uniref:Fungal lipase-type domain-containing protein n=1 Tax=Coniochaeta pulveracea TaxID=177199 RepID=A0A420Y350_9PEZI|nr:hypothetical protein DL546_002702 [Coniochaeta pulveracea]